MLAWVAELWWVLLISNHFTLLAYAKSVEWDNSHRNNAIIIIFCGYFSLFLFLALILLGGAPTSICHFFSPSVRPSVSLSSHPSCTVSQELYIMWPKFLVLMCKMMISPGVFFHFFKVLIFWVVRGIFWFVRGVKGQKMVQNDKKLCRLRSISQKQYIIWLSCMVHLCKMIISRDIFFHFFKILIFKI